MFRPVKLVDVELTAGIQDVEGLAGYGSLQALIRREGVPIGCTSLPLHSERCSAEALGQAIAEQHGPMLLRSGSRERLRTLPEASSCPSVSIAVCTRNRPASLAVCLESLGRLRYPRLELLVVDNAPDTDATERLVRSSGIARYVCEPRPGLDWARNRAIAETRGDILAYTDDDAVVDPDWANALARVFVEHADVMAVTGLVVPYELETHAQALFERWAGFGRGFERRRYHYDAARGPAFHVSAWTLGTGANMAFRRRLFDEIGSFDAALDVGTVSAGGGDLEMFFRVLEEGHVLVYEPAALVRHRHRKDYGELVHQMRAYGTGRSAFLMRCALAYPRRRRAIARVWTTSTRRRLVRLLRSFVVPRAITRDLLLADVAGTLVGVTRYHRARGIAAEIARRFGPLTPRARLEQAPDAQPAVDTGL